MTKQTWKDNLPEKVAIQVAVPPLWRLGSAFVWSTSGEMYGVWFHPSIKRGSLIIIKPSEVQIDNVNFAMWEVDESTS